MFSYRNQKNIGTFGGVEISVALDHINPDKRGYLDEIFQISP